jgi:LruC domain-containing protein
MRADVLAVAAFSVLSLPAVASGQDADGDTVPDSADAFPCDASRASLTYYPGATTSALLTFEDQWPGPTDQDFNDVAIRVHHRIERNAAQQAVRLFAVLDPVALGGELSNGLALALPASRGGVVARRRIEGGAWQDLTLEPDANATWVLSANLRELFANAPGRINSRAAQARTEGQRVELEITFTPPATLPQAEAPFDVFIFRSGDFGHQIHFPQYGGTQAMRGSLFSGPHDASTASRRFVHSGGVPAALNLLTTTRYPHEAVAVSELFPDIVGFAASAGSQNASFYAANVVPAKGHDVAARALPAFPAPDTSCVPVYQGLTIATRPNTTGFVSSNSWGHFHVASNGSRVVFYAYLSQTSALSGGYVGTSMSTDGVSWTPITALPGTDLLNPTRQGTPMSLFGGRGGLTAGQNFLGFYNGPVNGGPRKTYRIVSLDGLTWTIPFPEPDEAVGINNYGVRAAINFPESATWFGIQGGSGKMGPSEALTGNGTPDPSGGWSMSFVSNPDAAGSDDLAWAGPFRLLLVKGFKYSWGTGVSTGWSSATFPGGGAYSRVAARDDGVVVATGSSFPNNIIYSLDRGVTWTPVTTPSGFGTSFSAPVWTGKVFFTVVRGRVGSGFNFAYSRNGSDWTFASQPVANASVSGWVDPPVALNGNAVTLQNAIPGTDHVGIWAF